MPPLHLPESELESMTEWQATELLLHQKTQEAPDFDLKAML